MPALIQDLGIILITAGLVTLLFKKIGQPVVLGYLIAGFLVGPEINFIPTVQENDAIKIWAEIGVIVLLFGLGLEFSFKKLFVVGRGAIVTAITEVFFMLGLGFITGQAFGWSTMDSIFLGGILSISSTTIIIRAFDELGLRHRSFVNLVFGVLIVEDLVAILILVLLSTIAVTNTFEGAQLLIAVTKLGFFLSIWFLGGIFLVPWFLQKTRKLMNEETSLIVSLGLCLLMVILATTAGFSAALGAFIMGSILAETPDGEKIEYNLRGVRDLFAAIFFVSVGMLIELDPLKEYWAAVLIITLITIIGKLISTTLGALIGGQSIKTSVKSGMSLAQIGEFSFIIATLGLSLKVISDFLYPLAVAVSAITTFTTPYLIRSSEPFYNWLHLRLPERIRNRAIDDVKGSAISAHLTSPQLEIMRLFFNSIIIIAIGLGTKIGLSPILIDKIGNYDFINIVCAVIAVTLSLPSLWAVANGSALLKAEGYRFEDVRALTSQAILAFGARIVISLFLLGFVVAQFVSAFFTFILIAFVGVLVIFFGAKNFSKIYGWLEGRFLLNLNEKERETIKTHIPPLAPWDAHLSRLKVHPDSECVGKRLSEIGVREKYGVTIALIERGKKQILAPRRDDILSAFDRLIVIGTDEQLAHFTNLVSPVSSENSKFDRSAKYELKNIILSQTHDWVGKSIRESGIREATDGLVVGIERKGNRTLNPDSTVVLQEGDSVWLVGNPEKIQAFRN